MCLKLKKNKYPSKVLKGIKRVLQLIEGGATLGELGGRKLSQVPGVAVIELSSYRLLCRDNGASLEPFNFMSHQDYDKYWKNLRRIY